MPDPRIQAASSTQRLASLVDAYARRVVPAVLEQHPAASVSSALGVWLLLAVCAGAANGADRGALEEMLGCSAADAGSLLSRFMAAPPPALRAAIAAWVRARDASEELAAWARADFVRGPCRRARRAGQGGPEGVLGVRGSWRRTRGRADRCP